MTLLLAFLQTASLAGQCCLSCFGDFPHQGQLSVVLDSLLCLSLVCDCLDLSLGALHCQKFSTNGGHRELIENIQF